MRMHNKSIFKFLFTAIFIFGFFLSSLVVKVNPVFAAVGPTDGVTSSDFDAFNPLKIGQNSTGGTGSNLATDLSTPGGIISRLLDFAFPLAGLILFVMLVWGGFEMVYGANNTSKAIEAGKNRITTALIGFILLFASYWIMQLVEVILGITIF